MSFCNNVKSTLTTMKRRTDICDKFFILTTGPRDKQNYTLHTICLDETS